MLYQQNLVFLKSPEFIEKIVTLSMAELNNRKIMNETGNRFCRELCVAVLLGCMPVTSPADPDPEFATNEIALINAISQYSPGEQFRQLSLLKLVANGADDELLEYLTRAFEAGEDSVVDRQSTLQQYPTPLARIADPESMLQGVGQMIRFTQENSDAIEKGLSSIEENWPILVSMIDMNAVLEDAIIIRSAITDSLQYRFANPAIDELEFPKSSLLAYSSETQHQLNEMEYQSFEREMEGITNSAIDELSYKLDAYQRMTDDEIDPELLEGRIEAAESMNKEVRQRSNEQAYIRASTLYLMLIPAMVTVATD